MTTTSNSDEDLFTSYVLDKNLWYHIVAVRDGGTQGVYINGQLSDSRTCSTSPIDFVNIYDDNKVNIGRFSLIGVSPTHHLQGKIDDVRIYGRALSAEEIEELYESSLGNPPLFADADNGDYHLLSERGRYWPGHDVWVLDEVTSPGIDGGDPASDFSAERNPHSGRINMGAHGGTAYASMSEWWPFGDNNRDGKVNWLDFAIMAENWLEGE